MFLDVGHHCGVTPDTAFSDTGGQPTIVTRIGNHEFHGSSVNWFCR